MRQNLPTRKMREHPDLEQLKRQAKELLNGFRTGDTAAITEISAHYDTPSEKTFALHDAQLVIARSYGFDSWPKLKAFVDGVTIRQLVAAVEAGDSARVRKMLKARPELADMSVSYVDERRAIHYAVMHRRPEIVRLLMRNGADARAGVYPHRAATSALTLARERGYHEIAAIIEQEEERRPVHRDASDSADQTSHDDGAREAVANGDIEWLRTRHAEGKLVNEVSWANGGLLTVAVRNDRLDVLRLLLSCGFDPDERVAAQHGDWTAYSQGFPLWHAAALGRREMAELLLDHGANPNVHVDSSGSPVYSAFSHQQWEMAELLQRRGGIVTADIAAIYRKTGLARELLLRDEANAEELLRFAADGGATEIVRMALERVRWSRDDPRWFGMLASPLSFWHHIPWLYAGVKEFDRNGYLACFRLILGSCDVNVQGGLGRGILHEVAAMGDWVSDDEVVAFGRAALGAGARMDIRDELLKSTPLGWASRWGRPSLVRLLLASGADPDENDAEPWAQPRAWARKMGHEQVLLELGSRFNAGRSGRGA